MLEWYRLGMRCLLEVYGTRLKDLNRTVCAADHTMAYEPLAEAKLKWSAHLFQCHFKDAVESSTHAWSSGNFSTARTELLQTLDAVEAWVRWGQVAPGGARHPAAREAVLEPLGLTGDMRGLKNMGKLKQDLHALIASMHDELLRLHRDDNVAAGAVQAFQLRLEDVITLGIRPVGRSRRPSTRSRGCG